MANVRLKEFTSKFKEFDQFLEKSFDHPRCRQLGLDSFIMSPMVRNNLFGNQFLIIAITSNA